MRLAVFSDVHGNLSALEAVAASIVEESADIVICLGDLVGYGPDPAAVVEICRELAPFTVAGNHDLDVAAGDFAEGISTTTRRSQEWSREQLSESQLDYLATLPRSKVDSTAGIIAVHGCYLNDYHARGYVTEVMAPENLDRVAARRDWPKIALCGHTHVPMIAWRDAGGYQVLPARGETRWASTSAALLLNPGSVGQPRDGDPRAAYAVVDLEERTFAIRRVDYPVESVVRRMLELGLDERSAVRLREGR